MKKIIMPLLILMVSVIFNSSTLISTNINDSFHPYPVPKLSSKGKKVVDYLLEDWAKQFQSTDIATAMANLGYEPDDKLRLSIGEHFRENKRLARNLRWWGPNNYLLSNDEKLIVKYVIHMVERKGGYPSRENISKALNFENEYLEKRIDFIKKTGLFIPSNNSSQFKLADNYDTWGGPLRYNYHMVHIEGEKPFGVW